MEATDDPPHKYIGAREAFREFGWFVAAFATLAGAPSILTVLQDAVILHRLKPELQWIVDGYRQVMEIIGALLEPVLHPLLAFIGDWFRLDLHLEPIWRPLFALIAIYATAQLRVGLINLDAVANQYDQPRMESASDEKARQRRRRKLLATLVMNCVAVLICGLASSVIAGLMQPGNPLLLGLAATVSFGILFFPVYVDEVTSHWGGGEDVPKTLRAFQWVKPLLETLGTTRDALLWLVGFAMFTGILCGFFSEGGVAVALIAGLFARGIGYLSVSKDRWDWLKSEDARTRVWLLVDFRVAFLTGVSIVGGFVAAGLVLIVNVVL